MYQTVKRLAVAMTTMVTTITVKLQCSVGVVIIRFITFGMLNCFKAYYALRRVKDLAFAFDPTKPFISEASFVNIEGITKD